MTLHKALQPKDDVDILYVSRKEGGRGLAITEDSVEASILRLEDYIEKSKEMLIIAIRHNTDNTRKNSTKKKNRKKPQKKTHYECFQRLISNYSILKIGQNTEKSLGLYRKLDHIYQPLCSGRIWHKVNF